MIVANIKNACRYHGNLFCLFPGRRAHARTDKPADRYGAESGCQSPDMRRRVNGALCR